MRRKKLQKQRRIIISSVFISLTVGYAAFQTNITLKGEGTSGKQYTINNNQRTFISLH